MIDIQRYQNVAVGDTVADTQKAYEALLATNGVVAEGEGGATDVVTVKGTIRSMNQAVIEGNTHFYLTVEGEDAPSSISRCRGCWTSSAIRWATRSTSPTWKLPVPT